MRRFFPADVGCDAAAPAVPVVAFCRQTGRETDQEKTTNEAFQVPGCLLVTHCGVNTFA